MVYKKFNNLGLTDTQVEAIRDAIANKIQAEVEIRDSDVHFMIYGLKNDCVDRAFLLRLKSKRPGFHFVACLTNKVPHERLKMKGYLEDSGAANWTVAYGGVTLVVKNQKGRNQDYGNAFYFSPDKAYSAEDIYTLRDAVGVLAVDLLGKLNSVRFFSVDVSAWREANESDDADDMEFIEEFPVGAESSGQLKNGLNGGNGNLAKHSDSEAPAIVPIDEGKWNRDEYAAGTKELSELGSGVLSWVATVEEVVRKSAVLIKGMRVRPADFRIPPYQRKFAWKEENVRQLCRDLLNIKDESANYHLGTVILHRERKNDGEVWNVVDGQQRLTNIMTILGAPIFNLPLKQFLVRDYEMIRRVLADHSPALQQKIRERLLRCTLAFIAVENVSEAFQLFTTQNGRGKPLTPVNLLKAYHYKEMEVDRKRIGCEAFKKLLNDTESQWETANTAAVPSAPCDGKLLLHVFREYLYRLRLWSRGKFPQIPFDADRIGEFKGVTIREEGKGLPLQNGAVLRTQAAETGSFVAHRAPDDKMNPYVTIGQTIVNGSDFFKYAQTYVMAYKNVFVNGEAHGFLDFYRDECNPKKHKSGAAMYARHVFEALCLFCYDRFGSEGLSACYPALFACAYYERVSQSRVLYRRCGSAFAPRAIEKMMTTYSVADAQEALNELRSEIRSLLKRSVYAMDLQRKQKLTPGESLQRMAYSAIVK